MTDNIQEKTEYLQTLKKIEDISNEYKNLIKGKVSIKEYKDILLPLIEELIDLFNSKFENKEYLRSLRSYQARLLVELNNYSETSDLDLKQSVARKVQN